MKTLTVSTKQLRQDFGKVVRAMRNGQSLLLLYRSRPLAQLQPILEEPIKPRIFSKSQIQSWLREDRLSSGQLSKINGIIKRLP